MNEHHAFLWKSLIRLAFVSCIFVVGISFWSSVEARYGDSKEGVDVPPSQPTIAAHLVDEQKNALKSTAIVEVTTDGIRLIDPALAVKGAGKTEGHVHYQVDDGFVIATPDTKLAFHGLSPGQHRIAITLADDNHKPIGSPVVLSVTIPQGKAAQ
jgi:uncharacterized protein DUF6130